MHLWVYASAYMRATLSEITKLGWHWSVSTDLLRYMYHVGKPR